MLRRFKDKLGVQRDRHGEMTVADPNAAWAVSAALGRLHRHAPEMARALFPGIHGFAAESVAQGRLGWNPAERDPAARAEILKRVYLDAEKRSFRKHEQGLHALPVVGGLLAAPQTAEDIGNVFRRARDGDAGGALESLVQAALGVGLPAGRAAGKAAGRAGKKPTAAHPQTGMRDPDGDISGIDWSGHESTERYFREVHRGGVWRTRFRKKTPTVGAEDYKGKPIATGGGRPDVSVGEVRLYKDGERAYALKRNGKRQYIDRVPSRSDPNTVWKPAGDGGHWVTRRLDNGKKLTVYYNPYNLPEFPARGAFWLPPEVIGKSKGAHRRHVMGQIKTMTESEAGRKKLRSMKFSEEQIEQMSRGVKLDELGIQIHHDYRLGRMLIVDEDFHRFAHQGGGSTW